MEWAILRYRGSEYSKNIRKNRYFTRTYAGRKSSLSERLKRHTCVLWMMNYGTRMAFEMEVLSALSRYYHKIDGMINEMVSYFCVCDNDGTLRAKYVPAPHINSKFKLFAAFGTWGNFFCFSFQLRLNWNNRTYGIPIWFFNNKLLYSIKL